ncbi:hypothetical protein EUTSA_v10000554mg [Eutrema salsugineum]|uniref:F-box domain-containing protein n=1 Tax=Eutrema salsugineum TaxID=72664 RepID=V4LQQ1_EUTSA|nr:hypothetical protein EUTSA_v10000554mg [Eutrema salsugineum]
MGSSWRRKRELGDSELGLRRSKRGRVVTRETRTVALGVGTGVGNGRPFYLLQCQLIRRVVNLHYGNPNPYLSSTTALSADQSSLMLSSLPKDVLLNCLARVPKRYDPILARVSISFRSLVLSPELAKMRSLMGTKDYPLLNVWFKTETIPEEFHWFTFNLNVMKTGDESSIPFLSQRTLYFSSVSIGSKIYFIGGSMYHSSPELLEFDSLSSELCMCPSMRVARMLPGVAVLDGKIYVMGGCPKDQIQVEVFEPKTQTWEVGPLSSQGGIQYRERFMEHGAIVAEAVAADGKVYGMTYREGCHIIYNAKDGTCETFEMANEDTWRRGGVCVIANVIYAYYSNFGLMWYDSKEKVWRVVQGLKLDESIDIPVGMVDCNGQLAFLWEDCSNISDTTKKKIWCTMVVLERSVLAIHGKVEWSDTVGCVPRDYSICRCLGVYD